MHIQKILRLFTCILLTPLLSQGQTTTPTALPTQEAVRDTQKVTATTSRIHVSFDSPTDTLVLVPSYTVIPIKARASSVVSLSLYNETSTGEDILLHQITDSIISYPFQTGEKAEGRIKIVASDSLGTKEDSFYYVVSTSPTVQAVPVGIKNGINYTNPNSVILSLFLPFKKNIFVIGDFNNWQPSNAFQMRRSSDGNQYWIEINGLTPGKEYAFQYLVDGNIRIADPYADKILNENDQFKYSFKYSLYPKSKTTGIVSLLETNQQPYKWKAINFVRPSKENLVIYKLSIKDFVESHSYKALADSLYYLKKLGINAVELLPITEFSGNKRSNNKAVSYFAPDKYYGTKNDLKAFIDKAHQLGIAVILNIGLDQADYEFPYVKAYWDESKPSTNSPFFNEQTNHPSDEYFDFNHESVATQALVDTVSAYWLKEYQCDGLHFSISNSITQTNSNNEVNTLHTKEAIQIANWKRIYDKIRVYDKNAYMMLEHSGVDESSKILADYGIMLLSNMQQQYKEAVLGYGSEKASLNLASYKERTWSYPNLIPYMESHEEERLMVALQQYGNVNSTTKYSTKDLTTALDRMKLASAFYFAIPGPKMIWQFGELGYDLSIKNCPNGLTSDDCQKFVSFPKWEYAATPIRSNLYKVYSELIRLKTTQPAFQSTDFIVNASGLTKHISIKHSSMNVYVIGNFGVDTMSVQATFGNTGKWYDYFNGDSISVADVCEKIVLQPGEFHLFTTIKLAKPQTGIVPMWRYILSSRATNASTDNMLDARTSIYPNPNVGRMALKVENTSQNTIIINLYDLRGKLIQSVQLRKWQALLKHDMNFEKLPMGVYLLEIIDGKKKAVKKVYKN